MSFTPAERNYLGTQRLGRLATVDRQGSPQNNPVGFEYNVETGTIDIHGRDLGEALREQHPSRDYYSPEVIRIHPEQIFSWGVEPGTDGMHKRAVAAETAG